MYYPPKMAANFNILWSFTEKTQPNMVMRKRKTLHPKDTRYFSTNDTKNVHISGLPLAELTQKFDINQVDINPYLPISDQDLKANEINVQYLGYYLPWHPQECYYFAAEKGGFKAAPERTAGTYGDSSIDDKIDDLHYYTTFIKFGIGGATYDASQEVRNGDITRDEAVALVKRYDGEYSPKI